MNIQTDIVILGGGIAALQAACKLDERFTIHLLTKADFTISSSYKAQGGIAAVLSVEDNATLHIEDTLFAGEYHHHHDNVETLITHGSQCVQSLIAEHFPADVKEDGSLSLGLEGAHSQHRIMHAGGDATGRNLVDYYVQKIQQKNNVHIETYTFAYQLLKNSYGECCGVRVKTADGERTYFASHVILATGGAGALYSCTSNQANSYGDGIALAYLAGAEIADMEFVQFHPSLLYKNGARGLVSEAVRGAGAKFIDASGASIMEGKHPLGDLAPRHITAFEMYKMRAQGQDVFVDISMIENFEHKFPTITSLCHAQQIDIRQGRIPVAPGSHFLMGGIVATAYGATSIPRLYAIGEVACTGVHGANRLASNSLLEGLAFADLLADHLNTRSTRQKNYLLEPLKQGNLPHLMRKEQLQERMLQAAGIVRNGEQLAQLLRDLPRWQTFDLTHCSQQQIELYFMHVTAALIVQAALLRTESRGAHIRSEYTQQDHWQNKWIVFTQGDVNVRNTLYEHDQIKNDASAIFQ